MDDYNKKIEKTIESLKKNGIEVDHVQTGEDAKQKIISLIPENSEVITNTLGR